MEGLYLYCIREKTASDSRLFLKGIDGKGEVFALSYRGLEALISPVSLEEYDSEEIQRRAQEDLGWIKEKAVAHEKIIEDVMRRDGGNVSLIPMRFGIIFKEKSGLEETLSKNYPKLIEGLDRIRGKQEWSVKVYLKDRKKIERAIEGENKAIQDKKNELASLPEGMAFFLEEELEEVIAWEFDKESIHIAEAAFERLEKQAVASVKNKILAKELSGRREPMVLNAAYLIPEDKIEKFKKEIENLNQDMRAKGFELEYSGPWPCYNFGG